MSIQRLIAAATAAALASLAPSAALAQPADLQVQANGFNRIVAGSLKGGECHLQRLTNAMSADCTGGSSGTLTLYKTEDGQPICEVDFWYQYSGEGAPRWRAQISHQTSGSCAMQWVNPNTLNVIAGS